MYGAQGFDYVLPDLTDEKRWVVRAVLDGHSGKPEMAVFLRRTAETYLFLEPFVGTRREKLGRILAMDREVMQAARESGLTNAHCWLPPEIDGNFGKLIMHVGWKRAKWGSYFREIK